MYCIQCGTKFEGKCCPNCGQEYKDVTRGPEIVSDNNKMKAKKPFYKRAWFIILAALLVVGFLSRLGRGNETGASIRKQDQAAAQTVTPEEAKETSIAQQTTAPTSAPAESESENAALSTELRPEFKNAMDSYEAFMNEYVEFMKKYEDSAGTNPELIAQYAVIMSKYTQFAADFEKWEEEDMNEAEMKYYIEVEARVSQKLVEVAY